MIERRYRKDYPGEFVVINTDIRLGIKEQRREWIENPVTQPSKSKRAAVIGSAVDREQFDYQCLERKHKGARGLNQLVTYGTGQIWRDLRLDVFCSTNRPNLQYLQQSGYQDNTPIYTTARFCLMFPEKFFMIPFQPAMNDLASAIYLAAFDGFQDIYLFGYSQDTPGDTRRWQEDVAEVISTYNTHNFIFVGGVANMPDIWRNLPNADFWNHKKFLYYGNI